MSEPLHDPREELLTSYLLGDLPADEAEAVRTWIEGDDDARTVAREIEATLGLLRETLAPGDAPELEPHRVAAVFAASPRNRAPEAAVVRPPRSFWTSWPMWAGAAAAAFVMALFGRLLVTDTLRVGHRGTTEDGWYGERVKRESGAQMVFMERAAAHVDLDDVPATRDRTYAYDQLFEYSGAPPDVQAPTDPMVFRGGGRAPVPADGFAEAPGFGGLPAAPRPEPAAPPAPDDMAGRWRRAAEADRLGQDEIARRSRVRVDEVAVPQDAPSADRDSWRVDPGDVASLAQRVADPAPGRGREGWEAETASGAIGGAVPAPAARPALATAPTPPPRAEMARRPARRPDDEEGDSPDSSHLADPRDVEARTIAGREQVVVLEPRPPPPAESQLRAGEAQESYANGRALGLMDRAYVPPTQTERETFERRLQALRAAPPPPARPREEAEALAKLADVAIPGLDMSKATVEEMVDQINRSLRAADPEGRAPTVTYRALPGPVMHAEGSGALPAGAGGPFDPFDPFAAPSDAESARERPAAPRMAEPTISLSLSEISAKDALQVVAELADLRVTEADGQVVLTPRVAMIGSVVTRTYPVRPGLMEAFHGVVEGRSEPADQDAGVALRRDDARKFFSQLGVPFPEGTAVRYIPQRSLLVVTNTRENLDQVERILNAVDPELDLTPQEPVKIPEPPVDPETRRTLDQMREIRIPSLEFTRASIPEVVRNLSERLRAAGVKGHGLSVALDGGYHPDGPVAARARLRAVEQGTLSVSLSEISLLDAIQVISELADMNLVVSNGEIRMVPRDVLTSPPETRRFDLSPAELQKMAQVIGVHQATATDVARLFAVLGVPFPEGSEVRLLPDGRGIEVTHLPGQLSVIERILEQLQTMPAPEEDDPEPEAPGQARAIGVNPVVLTEQNRFSTFAIDVDTASYTLTRRHLAEGMLPEPELVRTEEFVNFFEYDYPPPLAETFALHHTVGRTPFTEGRHALKIGLKGRRLGRDAQRPLRLTLVVDTSGSMNRDDRMGLVKTSLSLLARELGPRDMVTLVSFSDTARLLFGPAPVGEGGASLIRAVEALPTRGATNLEAGLRLGYDLAARHFDSAAENRVLILSDGVANLGEAEADALLARLEAARDQGITCAVFGFGVGAYRDDLLERLANRGDGSYHFVDHADEARRLFVDRLSSTLRIIAYDVKIQVEFDPRRVRSWRQLGYENRQLTKEQFRDDSVDAGEVGSGQAVTALYEVELHGDPSLPLGVVRVRYREAHQGPVHEIESPLHGRDTYSRFDQAPARFRLAVGAAEFAELLRRSPYADGGSFPVTAAALRPVAQDLHLDARVAELVRLVETAGRLSGR